MEWNKIYYIDCMDKERGLPSIPDKSIDLCFTDIPFGVNINSKGSIKGKNKKGWKNIREGSIKYKDDLVTHKELIGKTFQELIRICNGIIIYCGGINLPFFCKLKKPRQIIYRFASNSFSNGSITYRRTIYPMVCYGKFNNRINNDLFIYPSRSGWYNEAKYIHPCPLNKSFVKDILSQIKPKSLIDPFIGSGTTAEVCTKLGIPYIGYEINEVYKQDIDKRLRNITQEPRQITLGI